MNNNCLVCKTCGKLYKACRTPNPGVFRWRDMACSPECASQYLQRVEAARAKADVVEVVAIERDTVVENDATLELEMCESGSCASVEVGFDDVDETDEDELDDEIIEDEAKEETEEKTEI